MKISVIIALTIMICLTVPVNSAIAYGGGGSGGGTSIVKSTPVPVRFTSEITAPSVGVSKTPQTVKPLRFSSPCNSDILFWHTMLMWTEIFDQGMGIVTLLPSFVKVPIGIVYHGPKNISRMFVYGLDRTIKMNENLQSAPDVPNYSGKIANTLILKPIRFVRDKVFGPKGKN